MVAAVLRMRFAAILIALALIASPALAADPPSTAAVIKSATFDAGVAPFSVGEIKSERPSLAYWGPIANVRRGTAGQSLWCAGTRQFPSIYAPSGFFPSYPYWGQLVQRSAEPKKLSSTTPVRLTYQGFSGSKVSSIVVKSSTGTIYKADTDYATALDAQGYTTIARKNTVIPNGATVYVDYYWPTSGTRGIATLDLPELAQYYRSWLSLYYLMPSLGAGDTNSFSFNWVDTNSLSSTDSHYGFPKVSGWTRIERELSAGQSVPLSRRPGQLRVQFFEFTDGTGARNGQGAAIDDVVVTGFKYGPVRVEVEGVLEPGFSAKLVDQGVELSWEKPARTPAIGAPADERPIAYRVWRRAVGQTSWTELTSGSSRLSQTSYTDTGAAPGSTYEYTVQAWDTGTGGEYGEPRTLGGVKGPPDTTPPVISVTGVVGGGSYPGPVSVGYSATDNVAVVTLSAKLNDATFLPPGGLVSAQGTHTLEVTATDAAGNTATRTVTFTIDTTPPVINVDGVSNGTHYKTAVTPLFSDSDNFGVVSRSATLNGAAFNSGTTVSAQGTHALVINATDAAGNTTTRNVTFAVDTTAPSISVYGVEHQASYPSAVTPVFSASDNVLLFQLDATLDGSPFTSGTSVSEQGPHTLVINAADKAGNTTKRTITFTIDTTAPLIELSGVENDRSYANPVQPVFSASHPLGDVDLTATLDGAPFSSADIESRPGEHVLVIDAASTAGNTATRTVKFTIDIEFPEIQVSGVTDKAHYKGPVTPVVSDSDNVGVVSRTAALNADEGWESGTEVSAEGAYVLDVTATDAAGNTKTGKLNFTIDLTMPQIQITGVTDKVHYKGSVTPVISDSDNFGVVSRTATLNGSPYTLGTAVTAQGDHELIVTATDAAGHTATRTLGFTIDTTVPRIDLSGVTNGTLYNRDVTPIFSDSDDFGGVTKRSATLNGVNVVSGTKISAQGTHVLVLTAEDAAGNRVERTTSFTIDTVLPRHVTPQITYENGVTKVRLSATDTGSGVTAIRYWVDYVRAATVAGTSATVELTGHGMHRVEYQAVDKAGNSSIPSTLSVYVKRGSSLTLTAPSISNYASAKLSGYLRDSTGKGLGGKSVNIVDAVTGKTIATVPTSSSGYYVYTAKPTKKTSYKVTFAAENLYLATTSPTRVVLPKVSLTRPSFGRTTLAYGKTYKATGYLKPRHKAYSYPVKIAAYRYSSGKYRFVKSYSAKAYNYSSYTKYVRSIKLPSKGKWRLRTVHAADSLNAKTYSSWRYITVK